jgi:molybdopterin-guanine dinucleotide biosynthesis protein A
MGSPKDLVRLRDDRTMLDHVIDAVVPLQIPIIISAEANPHAELIERGVRVIPDESPFEGPLVAIAHALEVSGHESLLVVCCDQPIMDRDALAAMASAPEASLVMFCRQDGTIISPFPCRIPSAALPQLKLAITAGERSPRRAFAALDCHYIGISDATAARFASFNSMDDLRAAGLLGA